MAASDSEIVVEDPDEPADDSPAVTSNRVVETVVYVVLIALAVVLGYDNFKSGIGWASDGPKSGYLPFYLCLILAAASLWGLGMTVLRRAGAGRTFVSRDQLRRVLQVFVPTAVFCALMQWLGLYVASFLLVAGFMRFIGRIAWWKCIVTALVFSIAMFVTFDVAFDVIMPKGPLEALFGK
ncbi:MAG: tripartite tricarboxylate transporter TctB family protein [Burkholderiales bacterium]